MAQAISTEAPPEALGIHPQVDSPFSDMLEAIPATGFGSLPSNGTNPSLNDVRKASPEDAGRLGYSPKGIYAPLRRAAATVEMLRVLQRAHQHTDPGDLPNGSRSNIHIGALVSTGRVASLCWPDPLDVTYVHDVGTGKTVERQIPAEAKSVWGQLPKAFDAETLLAHVIFLEAEPSSPEAQTIRSILSLPIFNQDNPPEVARALAVAVMRGEVASLIDLPISAATVLCQNLGIDRINFHFGHPRRLTRELARDLGFSAESRSTNVLSHYLRAVPEVLRRQVEDHALLSFRTSEEKKIETKVRSLEERAHLLLYAIGGEAGLFTLPAAHTYMTETYRRLHVLGFRSAEIVTTLRQNSALGVLLREDELDIAFSDQRVVSLTREAKLLEVRRNFGGIDRMEYAARLLISNEPTVRNNRGDKILEIMRELPEAPPATLAYAEDIALQLGVEWDHASGLLRSALDEILFLGEQSEHYQKLRGIVLAAGYDPAVILIQGDQTLSQTDSYERRTFYQLPAFHQLYAEYRNGLVDQGELLSPYERSYIAHRLARDLYDGKYYERDRVERMESFLRDRGIEPTLMHLITDERLVRVRAGMDWSLLDRCEPRVDLETEAGALLFCMNNADPADLLPFFTDEAELKLAIQLLRKSASGEPYAKIAEELDGARRSSLYALTRKLRLLPAFLARMTVEA